MLKGIDSIVNCKSSKDADVVILGVPYDCSLSLVNKALRGQKGVLSVLDRGLEFFDRFTLTEPAYLFRIAFEGLKRLRSVAPERMIERVRDAQKEHSDRFVVMLGGNHSVSIGAFSFFAQKFVPKDVTVLQIDAHLDLRNDTSDYKADSSRFDHACVMRRAYDFGYKAVHVGTRTYSKEEYEFIDEKNLTVFEWGRGDVPTIDSIIDSIQTDLVYLTIDIDGLDLSCVPGTNTPVPGGIEWDYASELLRKLFISKDVIGVDIVEVAPIRGDIITPYSVAQLLYLIVSCRLPKDGRGLCADGNPIKN